VRGSPMRRVPISSIVLLLLAASQPASPAGPPPDYPLRVHLVRLMPFGNASSSSASGVPYSIQSPTADGGWGTGTAVLLDQTGALQALQFRYSGGTGCIGNARENFPWAGGYFPARWVKRNEIAVVKNIFIGGKIQECSFEVKRSPIPATSEYQRFSRLAPDQMARIYERTSAANPSVRPAQPH
jgi:hypothetical protein